MKWKLNIPNIHEMKIKYTKYRWNDYWNNTKLIVQILQKSLNNNFKKDDFLSNIHHMLNSI